MVALKAPPVSSQRTRLAIVRLDRTIQRAMVCRTSRWNPPLRSSRRAKGSPSRGMAVEGWWKEYSGRWVVSDGRRGQYNSFPCPSGLTGGSTHCAARHTVAVSRNRSGKLDCEWTPDQVRGYGLGDDTKAFSNQIRPLSSSGLTGGWRIWVGSGVRGQVKKRAGY